MFVLGIDTSNTTLTVALVEDGVVLGEVVEATKNDHSKRLMPAIEKLFADCGKEAKMLNKVIVAKGPGSYTGIRIGVTVAKMLAWTLNIPLVAVSSLEALTRNVQIEGVLVPLFDARRETVFAGVYEGDSYEVIKADAHYDLRALLDDLKDEEEVYFLGNDAMKYESLIVEVLGSSAHFFETENLNVPHASKLIEIGMKLEPVSNVHEFVPSYLRIPEAEMNWLKEQERHD